MRGATGARAWPTGDLAYVNVNVNVNVNGDLAYVMGRSGVTVEAVVSCVECVLVVGPCERQRIQGDIPPGRVCLKVEDAYVSDLRNARPRGGGVGVGSACSSLTRTNERRR